MTAYALVRDGDVTATRLPPVGELPDGRPVSGFDKLDPATLKAAGWLPLDDPGPPAHNATQSIEVAFEVLKTKVTTVYTVTDLPPAEPEPVPVEPLTDDEITALRALLVNGS